MSSCPEEIFTENSSGVVLNRLDNDGQRILHGCSSKNSEEYFTKVQLVYHTDDPKK